VIEDPQRVLGDVCTQLGLEPDAALEAPSWNGKRLEEVYP
jgi:hypothetical protein